MIHETCFDLLDTLVSDSDRCFVVVYMAFMLTALKRRVVVGNQH